MANMHLTIQLWDYWIENNDVYIILEIIETNELYLLKRKTNDTKSKI